VPRRLTATFPSPLIDLADHNRYRVSNSCAKFLQVLQNRGYDGSLSDILSCGVILYMMLVGYLPFDDRNIVVLYQKVFIKIKLNKNRMVFIIQL
jgi:serine/threonine protein kinase